MITRKRQPTKPARSDNTIALKAIESGSFVAGGKAPFSFRRISLWVKMHVMMTRATGAGDG
jgi:hypothetical protein